MSWLFDSRDRSFLIAITLLLVAFAFLHSLVTPQYRGPDETQHVDMVIAVYEQRFWPAPGDRYVDLALRASKSQSLWSLRAHRREADEATPRGERATWNEFEVAVEGRRTDTGGINHVTQHPFLYYTLLAAPWGTFQSTVLGLSHDQAASGLRLLNLAYLAPLPLLVFLTGRALKFDRLTTRVSVVLLLFIPQLVHLFGLVNNDNLLILLSAVATFLLARVLSGDGRLRIGIGLGVAVGAALLTKGLALVWLPVMGVAYVHVGWQMDRLKGFLRSGVLAIGVAALVGGWWWIRNLLTYGAVQPRVLASPVNNLGPANSLGRWLDAFSIRFVDGFWGRFGTLDAALPRQLTQVLWLALLLLLAAGLWGKRGDERVVVGRWYRLYLVSPFMVLALLVLATSFLTYLRSNWAAGMQGRYLFPGIVGVVLVAGTGFCRLARVRELPLLASGVALQLLATGVMFFSWWGPREGKWSVSASLEAWTRWVPWPPEVIFVCLATLAYLVIHNWRQAGAQNDTM